MERSTPLDQESIGDQLIEDIKQFKHVALGEGAAMCQVCGSFLREGDGVVAYVFRPAGEVMFQVGYVVCGDERHELPKGYTLGVRELLVEGRVGWCSDGAKQSSWPVLLAPEVLAVSEAATKSARLVPDGGTTANVASEFDFDETEHESSLVLAKVSVGEARRRVEQRNDAAVRGLWGGARR